MQKTLCRALKQDGSPCRMRPLPSGLCWNHDEGNAQARQTARRKGGSLTQARKALAKAKTDAVARFGLEEPLPDLADVQACRRFLVGVAGKVLQQQISPAAANALTGIVRASKELLSLEVDIKLAEQLDALDAKDRRS
jgi:hypothetical protein